MNKLLFGWFETTLYRAAFVLNRWLYRRARPKWDTLVSTLEKGGTQSPQLPAQIVYRSNNHKAPEILTGSGSPGDMWQHRFDPHLLPRWAQEIQPFLQNQLSRHTRIAYESDLKQFFMFLDGRVSAHDLSTLRPEHIILYRKALEEGRIAGIPLQKSSINRKLASVKSFFQWLKVNRIVEENPAQWVKGFPQSQESKLQGLSDEEVSRILDLPKRNTRAGALHSAILHLLLYLGLRKGELLGLRIGDFTEERGIPVLRVRGKGHRVRVLPLTGKAKAAVEHYFFVCQRSRNDIEAPLFVPTKNPRTKTLTKSLNPHAITYLVQRYAKKAGVLKTISPHSCRATCISNALDRKATQRSVQHLAGWSTPLMIQRYDKRKEDLKNSAAFSVDYSVVPG